MSVRQARSIGIVTVLLLSAALVSTALHPVKKAAAAGPAGFRHVILIVQENRTPDNLFQGLCTPPAGALRDCTSDPRVISQQPRYDIQTANWLDNTATTTNFRRQPGTVPLGSAQDLGHGHGSFVVQCNAKPGTQTCRMDGAAAVGCYTPPSTCLPNPEFRYVDNSTGAVDPYLALVKQYGWANAMFQSNQGPSYPSHQFLFGGTSAPSAADDAAGIFVAENVPSAPGKGLEVTAGCTAAKGTAVRLITPRGERGKTFPCFDHATMADLLGGSLSWRYYTPTAGIIWTAPNSIKKICGVTPLSVGTQCSGPIFKQHVELHPARVLTDIADCKLRSMSWVIPTKANSDHGAVNDGGGPSWVASIVNAVGASTRCDQGAGYWKDTAIFITWDDWGGWYDHVPPTFLAGPQGDYETGFRVPLIVVSAYTPRGYINTAPHDFGSILRFIEQNFGIAEGALNFDDRRATTDLRAFFDLTKPPRTFQKIGAPKNAAFFLHDRRPLRGPDDE
jgi:phospholipase C